MDNPSIAATSPIAVELEAGQEYFYCTCGRSTNQPFCDGSHQGTTFKPLKFNTDESGERFLCRCKQTGNPPYCDGSHNKLSEDTKQANSKTSLRWYKVAEPGEMSDGESRVVSAGSRQVALTFLGGNYGAIDNRCPHQGVRLGRSVHVVDMADRDNRATYTALSNSMVGVILLAGGIFGFVAQSFGIGTVLLIFAIMATLAIVTATGLDDVQKI